MLHIPKKNNDLRRLVLRRDILRLGGYLVWLAVWLLGIGFYNAGSPYVPLYGWRLGLTVAAAALLGFCLFRMWKFFTDFSCRGIIETSGLSHSYSASADPGALKGLDYDFRLNTALKIKNAHGHCKTMRFEQKRGFYLYYHEGNEVVSFHGLPYPISTDIHAPHGYVCAACGTWTEEFTPHCAICGHTLIHPKDLNIK